jgi:aquaporin Z
LTGTSVNPARGLASAIFVGGHATSQVWLFIVAPLVGAIAAALLHMALHPNTEIVEVEVVVTEAT